jgi:putative SOS response-associated peptidase YedK
MCGAYGFSVQKASEVYDRFGIMNRIPYHPRWNLRPGQMNPVITRHSPNQIDFMFWGLIPSWANDDSHKYKTFNARAETVSQLPTYKKPFRYQRCLVPATGFYEPDKVSVDKPPYPWHYFQLKDKSLFAFAGLYDRWTDKKTGKELLSYTIITTEPNEVVGKVHNRMPVILKKEDENTWLNPDLTEPQELLPLLTPYPAELMEGWRVGDAARNWKNDSPELIKPVKEPEPLL